MASSSLQQHLINGILETAIAGWGLFISAEQLAQEYQQKYGDVEQAIDVLIGLETSVAAATGFVLGLGGGMTLPITLPASLSVSYLLAARLAATIAILRGWDVHSELVQSFVALSLISDGAKEILKQTGIRVSAKITRQFVTQISARSLTQMNKKIGFQLLTKAGKGGVINLSHAVPLVGGAIAAGFDSSFVYSCGQTAKTIFHPDANPDPDPDAKPDADPQSQLVLRSG